MKRTKVPAIATIPAAATAIAAAKAMLERDCGCLVVVDARKKPLGILTDRDLALRVVAAGRDPRKTTARMVMSAPLVAATATDSMEAILARMEASGVRRVPVLDGGKVVRIVTLDDLLLELGEEIADLGHAVRR